MPSFAIWPREVANNLAESINVNTAVIFLVLKIFVKQYIALSIHLTQVIQMRSITKP
jgi:hypothetical protein